MTSIANVQVFNLHLSMNRSGLPMVANFRELLGTNKEIEDRCFKLCNNPIGSGHDNFLKGIIVSFDIKYPEYLSPEMQRYHWFEIVSSMSKMHRLTQMILSPANCNQYVLVSIIEIVNNLIDEYNKDQTYENFMKVLSNCPLGFEKWMAISTNYLQLATIYKQRKTHKLKEDWGAICKMIEDLPYFEEFINRKGK